jgi:hypothetical protein
MTQIDREAGDDQTFELFTTLPDWEYGFALKNQNGDILYEIGNGGDNGAIYNVPTAPLFGQKNCTNAYGGFHNRMAPIDVMSSDRAGYVDARFGTCEATCRPSGEPWTWPLSEKRRMTSLMARDPAKGLGTKFSMFGTNSDGVCTMNIHNQNGASDDIMIHIDPRPNPARPNTCGKACYITDFRVNGNWPADYSGFRTQNWDTDYLGTNQENDPNAHWIFTYEYAEDGLKVYLGDNDLIYTASWLTAGAYDHVSYIDMDYQKAYHINQDGSASKCFLTPQAQNMPNKARIAL